MQFSRLAIIVVVLLLMPVHTGCRTFFQSIMNAVNPSGSSAELGISDREKRIRTYNERLNNSTGTPLTSDRR